MSINHIRQGLKHYLYVWIIGLLMLGAGSMRASVCMGGNITWECMGGNQYEVSLRVYFDCYGTPDYPSTLDLIFNSSGCTGVSSFSSPAGNPIAEEISDLCPSELLNSSCGNPQSYTTGVRQITYTTIVTLAPGCIWTINWNEFNWSLQYLNQTPVFNQRAAIQTTINTNFPCADSPDVVSTPANPSVRYFCMGQPYSETMSLTLPVGVTASLSLASNPLTYDVINGVITSVAGYSAPAGLTYTNNGNGTANIGWTPPNGITGYYIIPVQINVISGGNTIGTILETTTIVVRNCNAIPTVFEPVPVISTGTATTYTDNATGNDQLKVCAGDSLVFAVQASNYDVTLTEYTPRAIDITYAFNPPAPGLSAIAMVQTGTNPAVASFRLLTTGAMASSTPYVLELHAEDDLCPIPGFDDITLEILIQPSVRLTNNDTTVCSNQSVALSAYGLSASNYSWSVTSGDNAGSPFSTNPTQNVTPDSTTTYQVSASGISAGCPSSDQIVVHVPLHRLQIAATNESCSTLGSINLTPLGDNSSNLNYNWTAGAGGSGIVAGAQDQNALQGTVAGATYTVIVTDTDFGCSKTASATITETIGPEFTLSAPTNACEGGQASVTVDFTAGQAPFDVWTTTAPNAGLTNADATDVADPYVFQVAMNGNTSAGVLYVRDASGCVSAPGSIPPPTTINERPLVNATFSPVTPLCLGDALSLVVDFDIAGSYSVVYSIAGVNQPAVTLADLATINVPDPTTASTVTYDIESVSYTSIPACPSTDASNTSIDVVTYPRPNATLPNSSVSACQGNSAIVQVTLAGTAPWTITYTRDGAAQPAVTGILTSPYTLTPTVGGTYCLTSVTDAHCDSTITGECIDVVINPYPTLTSFTIDGVASTPVGSVDVCQGDNMVVEVEVTPAANNLTYVFIDTPDYGFGTLNNQSSSYQQTFTPTANFTLELDKIYFSSAPACSTLVNQEIDINIRTNISATQTAITCDNVAENYQITFTLSGGAQPYVTDAGSGAGTFAGNVFTTASLPSGGTGGTWIFSDNYNCNDVTMTNPGHTCPVISNAGVMTTTPLLLCSNGTPNTATGTQSTAYTADGNDAVMFILHSVQNDILGSEISRSCGNAVFGDAGNPIVFGAATGPNTVVSGTTYYISCVVGNANAASCVDVSHINTQFSTTHQAVTWFTTGSAALSASGALDACVGQTIDLNVNFTGASPWTFIYSINGTNQTPVAVSSTNPYTLSASQSGTYALVSITNSFNNCSGSVSGSETVTIHPAPIVTMSGDAAICGGTQHCFDLTFTSGTAPFTAVVNVPTVTANETVNNLSATDQYCNSLEGAYQILQITDNFGCTANSTASSTLSVYPTVSAAWALSGESYCPNEPNITATFITNGDGPFVIDLQGPGATSPTITSNTITIDAPGDYTIVSIEDTHGCVANINDVFTAVELTVPTANAGADVAQCAGLPIQIGTPAEPGLTYSWSPSGGIGAGQQDDAQPTVTIGSITNSPYTFTVSATDGFCSNTDQVVVTINPRPFASISANDDVLCYDAPNNVATITVTGQPTYTYDWAASASIISGVGTNTIDVDPSATEAFDVTVSEDFGTVVCSTDYSITIDVNEPLEIVNLNYPDQMCAGTCIAGSQVEFDVTGAVGLYTALLDGNSTSQQICFSDPQQHQLVVTDSENCEATADFTITVRNEENVMVDTNQGYPFCFNDNDGAVLGTNPDATNYILSLNGFNVGVLNASPFLFEGLSIGTYDLTVNIQLAGGQVCTADTTFSLEADSPEIFIDVNPPAALGCLNQDITFEALLSGGSGNFTTYWNSCPDVTPCQISVGDVISVLLSSDTILYVYGLDAIGCSSDTVTAVGTLSTPPSLFVQNGIDTLQTCQYECEQLTAFAIGGTGALTVEWYPLGSNNPLAVADTIEHCFLINQTEAFEVHLLDGGCSTSLLIDTLWVHVHDTPEPIMSADEAGSCYPDTIGLQYILLDNAYSDPSQCVWSLGNGTFINYCGDTNVVYTSAGEFYPTITITSQFGCSASDTLSSPIIIRGYPEVDFTWSPQPVDILHRQVHFQNLTAGAETIHWDFYSAGESSTANPFWTFPDIETIAPYRICLTAGNEFGCKDTLCQDVYVENILQVFVPNTFTPDGDGLNDVFLPIVNGELDGSYHFWVFNRWGDIVFDTEEVGKAWTGGYDGGTYYIPDGYYLWKIQVESLETGKPETYEGEVIIIR